MSDSKIQAPAPVAAQRSPKSNGRKKLLIHPQFQLLLLGVNFGVILLFSTIVWATVQNTLLDLKPAAGLSGMEVDAYRRFLDYQAGNFQTAILGSMVVGLIVSGVVTLLISHRFAGPLIRLRNYFRSIGQSADAELVPELSFRDGDYLGELPPLINKAFARVQTKVDLAHSKKSA
ncbi:MAG: hypothetical protein H7222_05580 [Methylotenera sp.]|nr:hypothetical protein [Oligoflexia bacterium]